ncbi:MAG: hypothetical protein F6K26_13405 [Moorea sp. SIO2I5]|nr:hypothetical protein [Moorena sp. SIO2I5]
MNNWRDQNERDVGAPPGIKPENLYYTRKADRGDNSASSIVPVVVRTSSTVSVLLRVCKRYCTTPLFMLFFVTALVLSLSTLNPRIPSLDSNNSTPEKLKWNARENLLVKGEDRIDKDSINEAISVFKQAQQYAPEDPQIAYYLAWLEDLNYFIFDRGECQAASKRYAKAIELFYKNPPQDDISRQMVIEIGHYLSNRDLNYNKAIRLYDKHILKGDYDISDPVTYMALVSRGMARFWNKDYGFAESDFRLALAEKPFSQVAYNLGSVYAMYRNYPKAISWYKSAIYGGEIKLNGGNKIKVPGDPKFDEALRDLGFALLLNEEYQEALDNFEKAIDVRDNNDEPPDYLAHVGKGIAEYFLRYVDEAKLTLRKVPSDDPYYGIANRYLKTIEECESSSQVQCVNHVNNVTLSDIAVRPILTDEGIVRVFGNVTFHGEVLDKVLELKHKYLYEGPCPATDN